MKNKPLVSLCIPTNGVIQWVFPVLDSIYEQGVEEVLFEVVVMDNGNNEEFCQCMTDYASKHRNIVYKKTSAYEFLSEIETYKSASGQFIKFINHRTKLILGTLNYYIDFVHKNKDIRPIIYFSNGEVTKERKVIELDSFDSFVRELSYWSSWSTGMAFWKEDFDQMEGLNNCNLLFPHTNILFYDKNNKKYIVDNTQLLDEIPVGKIAKGRYNLFHAFAVEYPALITDLYREKSISIQTLLKVKDDNLNFISEQYYYYMFRKVKCSYDLSGYKESIAVFYSDNKVKKRMFKFFIRDFSQKLKRKDKN